MSYVHISVTLTTSIKIKPEFPITFLFSFSSAEFKIIPFSFPIVLKLRVLDSSYGVIGENMP